MNFGVEKNNSTALSTTQGVILGSTIAGGASLASSIAKSPAIKRFYNYSLTKQTDLLDKFKKAKTPKGASKTIKEFIDAEAKMIECTKNMDDVAGIRAVLNKNIRNGIEGSSEQLKKFDAVFNEYSYSTKRQIKSKLNDMQKILKKGKTSKSIATKETILKTGEKIADKISGLKDNLKEAFSANGIKNKAKNVKECLSDFVAKNPVIKKAGKAALIGACVGAVIKGGAKLISNHKEAKNEKIHYEASEILDEE